jgi:broad specificity phosphatase PhoE
MHLFLIRHGETDWNIERRIQGHTDTPLNARGFEQAEKLAVRLAAEEKMDALYASPLARARTTAQVIGRKIGIAAIYDDRLKEKHLGEMEGMSFTEIEAAQPEVARMWRDSQEQFLLPGEEQPANLQERVRGFLDEMMPRHNGSRVAVISHGGTITMLLSTLMELDINRRSPFWFDNASISYVDLSGPRARLRLLNDTCHLRNGYHDHA